MSMPPPPPFQPNVPPPVPPGYQPYGYAQAQAQPEFASWGSRVGGHIINGLVAGAFGIPAIISFFAGPREYQECTVDGEPGFCKLPTSAGWAIFAVLAAAGFLGFYVLYCKMIAKTGQAWGHKAVNVRIVDAATGGNIGAGKAFWRYLIGHILNGIPCYLGYLWPLWDKNKQTFADKVFGTYSIKA